MRNVIASLILLTGLAGPALAQDGAGMAPEPGTSPAPAAVGETAAPPAPAPAAPAPAPVEQPTLPTTGNGAAVLSVLTRACIPMVQEGKTVEEVGKELGMKRNRRSGAYEVSLGGRDYSITVLPKGANDNVCNMQINYPVGEEEPIVEALNIWAFLHEPELVLQRNDYAVGADNIKRVTMAWEHYTDSESTGMVFVQLKKPDDSPLERGYDQATLLYSERTF
ncbi:hypothetical protein [Phenylobacterium sp.]|uniref:hypothetical protein n=1 Tax=Phenylobacterium sp. TaxID=1871053 RepID=UPI0019C9EFB9|nr:hypothetical protein [Phenylobacterium sp.]MBC7167056.1 hypothetical protein [Phenylobacterium sp.]